MLATGAGLTDANALLLEMPFKSDLSVRLLSCTELGYRARLPRMGESRHEGFRLADRDALAHQVCTLMLAH